MADLQIACLGELQVTLAGALLTLFQTDKNRALLLYLALEARVHQRAELAQFLWPGYSDESARSSLRQALHQLRQTLADPADTPWLLLTRQTVQLNPDAPIGVDVLTFRHLLATCAHHAHADLPTCAPCLARLRQAVELYRGDFLAGFTVADSALFEEWRRVLQEQLHVQMLDALTQLAAAAEAAGEDGQALAAARRLLTLEPWLEDAHRQVMRLQARQGQRAEALAQYQQCRQVLAEELGAAPDAETTALYEQIKRQRDTRQGDTRYERQDVRQGEMREADGANSLSPVSLSRVSLSSGPPHNLPAAQTPLIGRTQALTEIAERLQTPGTRLLTLVGPGGMGKTSLALAAGREQLPLFADGAWFVPLAAITTAALIPAIANALGLSLPGADPRSALLQTVRPKQMLLLLDNFEHLLTDESTALDLVVDLLEAAPCVQIIVTSRERLKLRSEQVYTVQPLPFADNAPLAEAALLPAVRLFVQATQRSHAAFQLTTGNLAAVLRICRLVQGMPLGLELAAANAGGAPLNAIADAIAQSAAFLAVEWRDVPERQRSMRALFAWSWQLLSPLEQRILRQSAVFLGGFAYAAAQAVLNAPLAALSRLVDKSLLQWQATASGEGRYAIHELLRQFAAEELQKLPTEAATVAAAHSAYYLDFVAARENRLARHEARLAADEIELEINNVRQAWRWAATNQASDDGQVLAGLGRAAYSLWSFYSQRANRAEAEQLLSFARQQVTPALADAADGPALNQRRQAVSKLLALHAELLVGQGKQSEAATTARQALALSQSCADLGSEVMGSLALGMALLYQNQVAEARVLFAETVTLAQRYHSQFAISEGVVDAEIIAREFLAGLTFDAGDYAGSLAYLHPSLQLSQTLDRPLGEQRCCYILARLAYYYGDYRAAQQEYEQTLALARRFGDRMYEANALIGLGGALRWQGAYGRAEEALGQGLALARTRDDVYSQVWALVELTRLYCLLGHLANAERWVTQLSQLMAARELFPESREAILLVFAWHAQAAGHAEQALAYAEKANQLNTQSAGYGLAYCLITLGGVQAHRQRWAAAAEAYQAAITCCQQLNNRSLVVEAQAGLAQAIWQQGDLAGALAQIEAMLPALAAEPRAGFNSPFFAYWAGYQVLAANRDQRATTLLQQGYDLLQQDAAALDAESRQRFLTAVPLHCDLVAAYRALSA